MECRKYRVRDLKEINDWYEARGMRPDISMLSTTGFIVPGIAAGFLITTDTSCCILEPFIANPDTDKRIRDEALHLIMSNLIKEARILRFTRIFGFSSNESMIERSFKHGFVFVADSTTVCKELD